MKWTVYNKLTKYLKIQNCECHSAIWFNMVCFECRYIKSHKKKIIYSQK
jgi:hypothetical protein